MSTWRVSRVMLGLVLLVVGQRVYGGSATWLGTGSSNWLNASNWSPNTVPNGSSDVAIFGVSTRTTVSDAQTSSAILLSGITFNAGASAYTITGVSGAGYTLSGAGVVNNSGIMQNFTVPLSGTTGGISFYGSASAGNTLVTYTSNSNAFTQFFETSTADGATFVTNGGGATSFADSASGGTGTFTTNDGAAMQFSVTSTAASGSYTQNGAGEIGGQGGGVTFVNTATAGSGTFINNPATVGSSSGSLPSGGYVFFTDSATAGSAVITNNGATVAGTKGTETYFRGNSTAGSATITNFGAVLTADDSQGFGAGTTQFSNSASAGTATIITNGGGGGIRGSGGGTGFDTNATADHGTFIVNGASISGGSGGQLFFSGSSTAANGTFTANGPTVSGSQGGSIYFTDYTTAASAVFSINGGAGNGVLEFESNSTAANAAVTTNGSPTSAGGSGETIFLDTTSAANATFINNAGAAASATGGQTIFISRSTAASATFTNNGATVSGALGGSTTFGGNSTADNATLIANGGTNGGGGGRIIFRDDSQFTPGAVADGGTSRIEVFGNGSLDISRPNNTTGGITVGSIEGDGNVWLGGSNNTLTVGSNNASTIFAGSIQNGGVNGGSGGKLTKIGSGTVTLSGASTYTGNTNINAGKLIINGSVDSFTVRVNSGGTLGGSGTINGFVYNNGGTVAPGDPTTLHVNNDYEQDSGGVLRIVIDGPSSFDKLAVSGNLYLDNGAVLELDFTNGFAPTTGEQFEFLTFGGVDFVDVADGYPGTFSQVNIVGLEPGFQYDVQPDGSGGFGLTANNDGVSTSVPEPASLAILGMGGLMLMRRKRLPRGHG